MAENKKSFLLYCDIIHTVKKLTDEQAGKLFKHILSYVNDEDPTTDDILLDLVFEPIKQSLKRDLKKYEGMCNRNHINGAKGGRPTRKPKKPTGLKNNPNNPKEPKKPDIDSDIDSDSDIGIEKKKRNIFIKPSIEEIKQYCIDRKNTVKAEKFFNHYESNGWMVGKNKMKKWKSAIITWEENDNTNTPKQKTSNGVTVALPGTTPIHLRPEPESQYHTLWSESEQKWKYSPLR